MVFKFKYIESLYRIDILYAKKPTPKDSWNRIEKLNIVKINCLFTLICKYNLFLIFSTFQIFYLIIYMLLLHKLLLYIIIISW